MKHPADPSVLLAIEPDTIKAYSWAGLDEVLVLGIKRTSTSAESLAATLCQDLSIL
jgi:hypothetical protein